MQFKARTSKKGALGALTVFVLCIVLCAALCTQGLITASAKSYEGNYYTDYMTFEEEQAAAADFNVEIAGEGNVLLKNNGALPFDKLVKDISVFGVRSTNLQLGGGGSGGISNAEARTLQESLEEAGYNLNPRLTGIYTAANTTAELDPETALKPAMDSYRMFDDAAIIVIGREGSEFSDMETHDAPGNADKTKHILEFNDNELKLINHVKTRFDKVVVLINASNPMELAVLQDDVAIDAVLWMGHPGETGVMAVGKLLSGEVNPSGRLVDIYPADFTKDPTWFNFGDNSHNYYDETTGKFDNSYNKVLNSAGEETGYASLDYEEGIYMGYRWYETAAAMGYFDEKTAPSGTTDKYYNRDNGVVYPFGYGLSYTDFKWEIVTDGTTVTTTDLAADGTITVKVKVTNEGGMAGKDVVQVYYSAPYTDGGGIEKSAVDLVTYAKTGIIQPGESETLTVSFKVQEMASFDYNNANNDAAGHKGYELDPGAYKVSLRANSHEIKNNCELTYNVASLITYDTNIYGNPVEVEFSNEDWNNTLRTATVTPDSPLKFTSREDFKNKNYVPSKPTKEDLTFSEKALKELKRQESNDPKDIDAADNYKTAADGTDILGDKPSWVVDSVPSTWDQATKEEAAARTGGKTAKQLEAMRGLPLNDSEWDTFLNQLTYDELVALMSSGRFSTVGMDAIGKPAAKDADGPAQLDDGTAWCSEVVIASTWNVELAEIQGQFIGNESLFLGVNGWYGPAADTHRNPFAGRNFEYYSQDGVQGGMIAAAVIKGAQSKGMHVYFKHFFLNDQETDRGTKGGLCTWANEQAMRQIYMKMFEIAYARPDVKCNGTMTAFNRIGMMTSASDTVYVNILEKEWGFEGISVTDMYNKTAWGANRIVRAHTLPLGTFSGTNVIAGTWDETKKAVVIDEVANPTQWHAVRTAVKQLLYTAVNSNLMGNYLSVDKYVDTTIDLTAGVDIDKTIAVADLGTPDASYSLASGKLPDGITMDANGKFSGTPTASGTFTANIKLLADHYVNKTVAVKFNVAEALALDKATGKVGENFSGKLTSEAIFIRSAADKEAQNPGYDEIEFSVADVNELPRGIVINPDGTFEGAPIESGTFDFTVNVKASKTVIVPGSWPGSNREEIKTINVAQKFSFDIAAADVVNRTVTLSGNFEGAKENKVTVADGEGFKLPANPTREGYIFTGWYTDEACTTAADTNAAVTGDVTYYAGWSKEPSNTMGTVALIIAIVGVLAGAAAIVLFVLKKKA